MPSDEDQVFEAVRARVESGDYLDERRGLPGIDIDGGGAFMYAPDGRLQRMYHRGSPEYDAARSAGRLAPLPPLTPASEAAVHECEALLGHGLPPLLRRCYLELADGGFGPAYGLSPLHEIITNYKTQQQWGAEWQQMTKSLLPICEWGCAITSYVDCATETAKMWALDPNPAPTDDFPASLFPQPLTLTTWLNRWLNGTLQQPWLVQDGETGEWRGATDEEYEALED